MERIAFLPCFPQEPAPPFAEPILDDKRAENTPLEIPKETSPLEATRVPPAAACALGPGPGPPTHLETSAVPAEVQTSTAFCFPLRVIGESANVLLASSRQALTPRGTISRTSCWCGRMMVCMPRTSTQLLQFGAFRFCNGNLPCIIFCVYVNHTHRHAEILLSGNHCNMSAGSLILDLCSSDVAPSLHLKPRTMLLVLVETSLRHLQVLSPGRGHLAEALADRPAFV